MKKIAKISLVAAIAVACFTTANAQPLEESNKGSKCEKGDCKHKKFDNLSVEDIKKHVSEKVAFKEKNLAAEKECLNKNEKEELVSCLKTVKQDKKEFKKEHKGMKGEKPQKED